MLPDLIVHCGDVGAGHKVKLVNNMLSLGYGMVTAEALLRRQEGGSSESPARCGERRRRQQHHVFQRLAAYAIENDNTSCASAIANAASGRALPRTCVRKPGGGDAGCAGGAPVVVRWRTTWASARYVPSMVDARQVEREE
jgi:hypothetical protein